MLDAIGRVFEMAAPAIIGLNYGPIAAAAATEVISSTKSEPKIIEGTNIIQGDPVSTIGFTGTPVTQNFETASSPGFFAPGGTRRQGLRDFGGFLGDESQALNWFGNGHSGLHRGREGE